MASERLMSSRSAHPSTAFTSLLGSRTPTDWSASIVTGRPIRDFCLTEVMTYV